MLLDSEEGVDLITKALKKQHKMLAYGMIRHIRACDGREGVSELELLNQFEFLNGAVISPMISFDFLGLSSNGSLSIFSTSCSSFQSLTRSANSL